MPRFERKALLTKFREMVVRGEPLVGRPLDLAYDADVVSSNADRRDGAFDRAGRSIPAEQLRRGWLAEAEARRTP